MKCKESIYRFIFSGGGTGGHLFPAVAVAEKVHQMKPESDILFIGTRNKLDSEIIPGLGFKYKSLWVSGFLRKFTVKNFLFPVKLLISIIQSLYANIKFKPRVTVASGSYVAGPVVWGASIMGSKIVLLEQNSYPGITNRLLEKKADEIYISFKESQKYFRQKSKLVFTGNPIRINLKLFNKNKALESFNLNNQRKTILVLGGSQGADSINQAVKNALNSLVKKDIQVIWQTGKKYFDQYTSCNDDFVKVFSFIQNMSAAYSACDLVVARSGATTISEVSNLGVPAIFIPSPNVAADHQFKNACSIEELGGGSCNKG
ncbi:undecaprenyldiphospho-muramoylpentapeptide beta-N-acetylglucosaminyltransferase [Bacteroidota bacterium]